MGQWVVSFDSGGSAGYGLDMLTTLLAATSGGNAGGTIIAGLGIGLAFTIAQALLKWNDKLRAKSTPHG